MIQIINKRTGRAKQAPTTLIAKKETSFSGLELSMLRTQGVIPERTQTYKTFVETFEEKKRRLSLLYAIDKQQSHMKITSTGIEYYIYGAKLSKATISNDAFSLLSILLNRDIAYSKYS